MRDKIKELYRDKAKLVADARKVHEVAEKEKRSMSAEEQQTWDRIMGCPPDEERDKPRIEGELDDFTKRIKREEVLDREERRHAADDADSGELENDSDRSDDGDRGKRTRPAATKEYRKAYSRYLKTGHRGALLGNAEFRDLQSDSDVDGGYLQAPEVMATDFIKAVDDLLFLRQLSRTEQVPTADSLGIRARTAKASTFAWSSELAVSTKDSTLKFGKRVLTPHHLTGEIDVSRDLLRRVGDTEAIVREELARDGAEVQETAFLTGHGSQQPLGVFTATDDGIGTGRDVSTGNTTTELKADNLREVKYSLKTQYRRSGSLTWLFHRDAIKQISLLKDGNGQYLWQPGITVGDPDRILNMPFNESERVPNTFTTGLYVGILGDFQHYRIADALDMEIQRGEELLMRTNLVVFIARMKTDGMPTLGEAFARVTLA